MKDFEARTLLLKLANDYHKLADRAEDRAARDVPGQQFRRRSRNRHRPAFVALLGELRPQACPQKPAA